MKAEAMYTSDVKCLAVLLERGCPIPYDIEMYFGYSEANAAGNYYLEFMKRAKKQIDGEEGYPRNKNHRMALKLPDVPKNGCPQCKTLVLGQEVGAQKDYHDFIEHSRVVQ